MPVAAGPYFKVPVGAFQAPFYALRFDKDGRSQGPQTQQHLLDSLPGEFTDVFVFSHGWNNDWETALARYKAFISVFQTVREAHAPDLGRDYKPLLAGVFWPSTALVLPDERGPQFAGVGDDERANAADLALGTDFAERVDPAQRERYYDLLDRPELDEPEARELLTLLEDVYGAGDDDLPGDQGRDVDDLVASWTMYEEATSPAPIRGSATGFGSVGGARRTPAGPQAAGVFDKLDPRKLLRMLTVYQMKDRAGLIGTRGVGALLRDLLVQASATTRFHLVGHSYGARVLLNAIARPSGGALSRPVSSLLLLQPAVNHLCFGDGQHGHVLGGYREALAKVSQPILTTFSNHDFPLHDTFHLSLRRGKDIGEIGIAADEPPNQYAALGGYGPRGLPEWDEVALKPPGDPYELGDAAPEIWAVNGASGIKSHGDVVNEATAWALLTLVKG